MQHVYFSAIFLFARYRGCKPTIVFALYKIREKHTNRHFQSISFSAIKVLKFAYFLSIKYPGKKLKFTEIYQKN